jgi:hypothetical protein
MFVSALLNRLGRGVRKNAGRGPLAASANRRHAPTRSFRPRLEALETREVLSTFTVVLATDAGGLGGQKVTATTGDLRYCIAQADAAHAALTDTIQFSPTLFATPQTITLKSSNGPLVINDSHPLSILGPSGNTVTVSGGDATEVFDITAGTVSISNLAIAHGHTSGSGGGISNTGILTLSNCTLDHDSAGNAGGGLYNLGGTATLVGCTFNHDSATGTNGVGGGIFSFGTLSVTNCNLSNDTAGFLGGGIYIHVNSTASLTNCTLSNDSAIGGGGGDGGGVFVDGNSTATLTNCTLSNDKAGNGGGGLCTDGSGPVTFNNCTLSNDSATQGGGICNTGGIVVLNACTLNNDSNCGLLNEGKATVTASTFSNDTALAGGGLENVGTATLTNCTFSNDSATSSIDGGGGIFNEGGAALTLTNCTLANNSAVIGSGGGIWNAGGGILNLTNTIVAENTAAVSGPDIFGIVNSADHDLIGDGSGMLIVTNLGGNLVGTSITPIDPRLGPLQYNGGPTQTLALLAGSPAIGRADNAKAPATDQRGVTRIDEFFLFFPEATDIGAFEF